MAHRLARVAVIAAAACGAPGPVIHSQAEVVALAPSPTAEMTVAWHDAALTAIAQPVAIGDVVVATIVRDEQLYLVGVDAATGARRWQQPMSFSLGGFRDPLAIGDDRVAYLRPAATGSVYPYVELVVADVHTGAPVWAAPARVVTGGPQRCGAAICVITEEPTGDRREHGRLDVATGAYTVDNADIPLRAFTVSDDAELLDLGDYPRHTLGLLGGGRLQWYRRYGAIFPSAWRAGLEQRWRVTGDTVTGSLLGGAWRSGVYLVELADETMSVGLAARTGEVAWRDRGTALCGLDAVPHVRCRARGRLKVTPRSPRWVEDLDITIEGFTPETGATTWSLPVGAAPALLRVGIPAVAGPTQRLLLRARGALVVDFATGTASPPAPGAAFWCLSRVTYDYPALRWLGGYGPPTRAGGQLAHVCDGRGVVSRAMPSAAATLAVGARVGDRAVIATRDGLYGFAPR